MEHLINTFIRIKHDKKEHFTLHLSSKRKSERILKLTYTCIFQSYIWIKSGRNLHNKFPYTFKK